MVFSTAASLDRSYGSRVKWGIAETEKRVLLHVIYNPGTIARWSQPAGDTRILVLRLYSDM